MSSLLLSCNGQYGRVGQGTGGLVVVHQGEATVVDELDSTGLSADLGLVFRFLRGERTLVGYDTDGRVRYRLALPEVRNGHDVRVSGGLIVAVSTGENRIRWYDGFGRQARDWKADGEGDAWHLNCLWPAEGGMYVSAFGAFRNHRDWHNRGEMCGFVLDLVSGERVMDGLYHPHSPRYIDNRWVVCDSGTGTLVGQKNGTGRLHRVPLGGYPRGMACDEDHLYVGVSMLRGEGEVGHIAVLERARLKKVAEIPVPLPEIYEVLVVPDRMARGLLSQRRLKQDA